MGQKNNCRWHERSHILGLWPPRLLRNKISKEREKWSKMLAWQAERAREMYIRPRQIWEVVILRKSLLHQNIGLWNERRGLLVGQINNIRRWISASGALFLSGSEVWHYRKKMDMVVYSLHTGEYQVLLPSWGGPRIIFSFGGGASLNWNMN